MSTTSANTVRSDGPGSLVDFGQQVGNVAKRDGVNRHRVEHCRIPPKMSTDFIFGARSRAVLLQKPFGQRAERVECSLHFHLLFRSGITTQSHLGVEFAGNVARLRELNCGHLAKDEAARPAADLVLKNPRPGSAGANANAKARNVVVKNDAVVYAFVELQVP
jgi:hypothetical protein